MQNQSQRLFPCVVHISLVLALVVSAVLSVFSPPKQVAQAQTGTQVLDNFDGRTAIGGNWAGDTGGFTLQNNALVASGDKSIYWNQPFSGEVTASVKLITIGAGQSIGLHLRATNNYWSSGVIEVKYTHGTGVLIYTFDGSTWSQRGNTITATLQSGDVFKARSMTNGTVEVYKNGSLIGLADTTNWVGYNRTGQIGIWAGAAGIVLDDFAGGSAASGGGGTGGGTSGTNLAPSGTAYRWQGISSWNSNSAGTPDARLNDNDLSTDVDLSGGTPQNPGVGNAAGVIWNTVQTITTVRFINGTVNGNGAFVTNLRVQYTTDGSTWSDASGWTISPAYPYDSAAAAGQTYTFSGPAFSNVRGVRVIGGVNGFPDRGSNSTRASVREVMAYASSGSSSTVIDWCAQSGIKWCTSNEEPGLIAQGRNLHSSFELSGQNQISVGWYSSANGTSGSIDRNDSQYSTTLVTQAQIDAAIQGVVTDATPSLPARNGRTQGDRYLMFSVDTQFAINNITDRGADYRDAGMFLARDIHDLVTTTPGGLYYSAWYYFPQTYTSTTTANQNMMVMEFMSYVTNTNTTRWYVPWSIHLDSTRGVMAYRVDQRTLKLGQIAASDVLTTQFQSQPLAVPTGKWTHLQVFVKQAPADANGTGTGQVIVYQDGAQIFQFNNIPTTAPNASRELWTVTAYAHLTSPPLLKYYIDDAAISTGKL